MRRFAPKQEVWFEWTQIVSPPGGAAKATRPDGLDISMSNTPDSSPLYPSSISALGVLLVLILHSGFTKLFLRF